MKTYCFKVEFTDGSVKYISANRHEHNAEHRMFIFIPDSTDKIFIPDRNVKIIGLKEDLDG